MVLKLMTFRTADHKYLNSSELWCLRNVEKISCTIVCEMKYYIELRRKGISTYNT